jgi:glycosyltransferase involved in cell wall biosynthesis
MTKPLVSVVMVICNVERFLAESIDSILSQTFRDFEFIIVDFGSADKSNAIASRYAGGDSRLIVHEIPHCGLAEARNAACSLAQGQYIALMDADDVSVPDRLASQVGFMEKHPEVGFVGGATRWIDATGKSLRIDSLPATDSEIRSALVTCCPFCQPTILMRREAFTLVGGYRPVFAQAEDYDLWLRIADHYQCANLEQVVLHYRIHPNQLSLRKRTQQTLCVLAAQVSASSRKNGQPDPMDSAKEITPALLTDMGISEATQQTSAASEYLFWLRTMYAAGEYAVALKAVLEVLHSPDRKYAQRWQVADLRLMAARLYWKQRRFARGLLTAGHAFMTRPVILVRPLKQLLF